MPFEKGNLPHNFKDLTGQKYNNLLVLSYHRKSNGGILWNCKCDCGNNTTASSYELTHSKKKSCGCLIRKCRVSLDFVGYENEDIIVIALSDKKSGKEPLWEYKCKHCGKINSSTKGNIKRNQATCKCIHYSRVSESESMIGRNTKIYQIWCGMKTRCFNEKDSAYKYYGGRGVTICEEWKNNFELFYNWSLQNGYEDGLSIERKNVNENYCPENCCWIAKEEQARNKTNTLYIEINGEKKRLKEWCKIYNVNYKTVYQKIFKYGKEPIKALTEKAR